MPNTPMDLGREEDDVPLEGVLNFIKVAIDEGVKKIRITGGEPLLRKGIVDFIGKIYEYSPNIDIALTTNAYLLAPIAKDLKQAGLKRINISLDSLKKEKIVCISKRDGLEKILLGIEKAHKEEKKVPEKANFCVRVNGSSMEPAYKDGDIVFVQHVEDGELREGEIGVFLLNGEGYIKRLGDGTLVSLNPEYEPIPLHDYDSFRCQGRVLGKL